jgi:two-component system, sensor histidine kinase
MAQLKGLGDRISLRPDAESSRTWGIAARFAVILGLAAGYVAAGKIGLRFAMVHANATAIWAPSGIALAGCLLLGWWVWPAILGAAFLVNISTAGSISTSIGIAAGNTLEALIGWYLIEHYANGCKVFERTRDAFRFLASVLVSTSIAATIGLSSLCLGGYATWSQSLWIWLTWWVGDTGGDLIVVPFLLLWAVDPRFNWNREQRREALLLFLGLLITGVAVFGGWLPLGDRQSPPFPPGFLCFPILMWAALRFGPRESATAIFVLSIIAVIGTLKGLGPFAYGARNHGLLVLQTFLGLAGLIAVTAASAITERRRLDEIRSELAAIVNCSDEAILGITLDGHITSWNESAARIFGFPANEVEGKHITVITPVDRLTEQQEIIARLGRGDSVKHLETIRKKKSGERIDVSLTVSPIKDKDGRIVGASQIVHDISREKQARRQREELLKSEQTARTEAEKALSMLRQLQMVTEIALGEMTLPQLMTALLNRLCAALEADAAAILLVEPDGKYLSPTSSVGLRQKPLRGAEVKIPIGRGIAGTIAVSPHGLIFDDLSQVQSIRPFLRNQLSSLIGTPLRVEGRVIGVIYAGTKQSRKFTADDLNLIQLVAERAASAIERTRLHETERLAREAAEAANQAKDEFLAMLGHELRNPLHAIVLAVQLLEDRGISPDGAARARTIIARQANHVARLIDDLLDVSRVTSGRIGLVRRSVNLADSLSECVSTLRETHQLDHHTLQMVVEPVWVDGDSDRLIQIISNLLGNAIKYTHRGGKIQVSVHPEDAEAVLRVEDNGIGIPAAFQPRVFDLFTRGVSPDRSPGGLGVGLTLVRSLVELHGGRVEVFSDGLNHGTTFVVRLPQILRPAAAASDETSNAIQAEARRRILIVEDNPDAREGLRGLLELSGHDVFEAADGCAAVKAARALRPEVALIDIGLPGIDGNEVARQIRSSAVCDDTVLIALTGYSQREDRQQTENAGFQHYLVKPVDLNQLAQLISSLPKSANSRSFGVEDQRRTSTGIRQTSIDS